MGNLQTGVLTLAVFDRSLTAARAGSSSSLGTVLQACRAYLLVVAQQELHPDLQAKVAPSDLVQETCLEAHRHFKRFNGTTKEELTAWLRSILHRRLQKVGRKYRLTAKRQVAREFSIGELGSVIWPTFKVPFVSSHPGSQMIAQEDAAKLTRTLARLPSEYQQVIFLRNWELRSFADIGTAMDRSAEASRSLWSRAVQRLGEELESCDARPRSTQ